MKNIVFFILFLTLSLPSFGQNGYRFSMEFRYPGTELECECLKTLNNFQCKNAISDGKPTTRFEGGMTYVTQNYYTTNYVDETYFEYTYTGGCGLSKLCIDNPNINKTTNYNSLESIVLNPYESPWLNFNEGSAPPFSGVQIKLNTSGDFRFSLEKIGNFNKCSNKIVEFKIPSSVTSLPSWIDGDKKKFFFSYRIKDEKGNYIDKTVELKNNIDKGIQEITDLSSEKPNGILGYRFSIRNLIGRLENSQNYFIGGKVWMGLNDYGKRFAETTISNEPCGPIVYRMKAEPKKCSYNSEPGNLKLSFVYSDYNAPYYSDISIDNTYGYFTRLVDGEYLNDFELREVDESGPYRIFNINNVTVTNFEHEIITESITFDEITTDETYVHFYANIPFDVSGLEKDKKYVLSYTMHKSDGTTVVIDCPVLLEDFNPAPLLFSVKATPPKCPDGSDGTIIIETKGGTPKTMGLKYNYYLDDVLLAKEKITESTNGGVTTATIANLPVKVDYTIKVTDANDCTEK